MTKKTEIISIEGEKKGIIELPKAFESEIRIDLIKRAYESEQSLLKPSYGSFPLAGKLTSAPGQVKHARAGYKAHYGYGISRVPRKILSRRGTRFFWVGAFIPGARGGRAAHPPKAYKNFEKRINKKERKKAFYSALSAPKTIVIEKKFEDLKKIKEIKNALEKIVPKEKNILIITSKKIKSGDGIKIVPVKQISISDLAPNAIPRKIVLWTENAIKEIK
ncbi:MAG: 50S ribosomal protein L4 [Candidatus Pacearchaeota archaeon]